MRRSDGFKLVVLSALGTMLFAPQAKAAKCESVTGEVSASICTDTSFPHRTVDIDIEESATDTHLLVRTVTWQQGVPHISYNQHYLLVYMHSGGHTIYLLPGQINGTSYDTTGAYAGVGGGYSGDLGEAELVAGQVGNSCCGTQERRTGLFGWTYTPSLQPADQSDVAAGQSWTQDGQVASQWTGAQATAGSDSGLSVAQDDTPSSCDDRVEIEIAGTTHSESTKCKTALPDAPAAPEIPSHP